LAPDLLRLTVKEKKMKAHIELTKETIDHFGHKLYRIRAKVDIETPWGKILKGTIGGWVEKIAQVSGDAWVSGDARVYGNAQVSGDARVSGDAKKTPILLSGFSYTVTIQDKGMSIGCEYKTFSQWKKLGTKEISEQYGESAGKLWKTMKPIIFKIVTASGRKA